MDIRTEELYKTLIKSPVEAIEGQILLELNLKNSATAKDGDTSRSIVDRLAEIDKFTRSQLERMADFVKLEICQKRAYCEHKDAKIIDVITTVADGVFAVGGVPIAPATLATYAIKKGYLDKACGCQ